MIRLALISHLTEISGAGVALLDVAVHLDRRKYEPIIIFPGNGPLVERAKALGAAHVIIDNPQESMASASWFRRGKLALKRLRYVRGLSRCLQSREIALVYVNTTASIFPGIAAVRAHKPIIWHVHELIENPSRAMRRKLSYIEKHADAIVHASLSGQSAFPARSVRRQLIMPNHIDVDRHEKSIPGTGTLESLGVREEEFMVLMNGMFPRKAPDIFLQAASRVAAMNLRPVRFVILGEAQDAEYGSQLQRLAHDGPLQGRTTFAGIRHDIPALLKRADLFVSPSRNEARPIIIAEAMAAGTPVIATRVGDCALMLGEGRFGTLVAPDDSDALAQAMADAIRNHDSTSEKAALALEHVRHEYQRSDFWTPLEMLIDEVARQPGKTARS